MLKSANCSLVKSCTVQGRVCGRATGGSAVMGLEDPICGPCVTTTCAGSSVEMASRPAPRRTCGSMYLAVNCSIYVIAPRIADHASRFGETRKDSTRDTCLTLFSRPLDSIRLQRNLFDNYDSKSGGISRGYE